MTLEWVVPVVVGGARVEVAGASVATVAPIEELALVPTPDDGRSWLAPLVVVAAVATVGLAVALGLGRRGRREPAS